VVWFGAVIGLRGAVAVGVALQDLDLP
jgi:hypothetical protein